MIGDETWAALSPDEKRHERFKRWLAPGTIRFSSPEAEEVYKQANVADDTLSTHSGMKYRVYRLYKKA